MKKKNKSTTIINQIQKIRTKNNVNWMNLLRLAFKKDPKNASKILSKITKLDKKISLLTTKLQKISNQYKLMKFKKKTKHYKNEIYLKKI